MAGAVCPARQTAAPRPRLWLHAMSDGLRVGMAHWPLAPASALSTDTVPSRRAAQSAVPRNGAPPAARTPCAALPSGVDVRAALRLHTPIGHRSASLGARLSQMLSHGTAPGRARRRARPAHRAARVTDARVLVDILHCMHKDARARARSARSARRARAQQGAHRRRVARRPAHVGSRWLAAMQRTRCGRHEVLWLQPRL
mmetsp:Transcript_1321/g.4315  ORF Transcript_1321/g.4315 Transcript_1321/m.4315 type:complete len:200 (+) Transcript_1321:551-1150(+)